MYNVNLIYKNSPIAQVFTFKAHKNADDLYKRVKILVGTDGKIDIEDDFGSKSTVEMSCIAAVNFIEYEKEMAKNGEIQILQTKQDLKTQVNAKNDVGLRILGDAASHEALPGEHKLVKAS